MMKLVEHSRKINIGQTAAVVFDGNDEFRVPTLGAEPDDCPRRRVLCGILEQVGDDLLDERCIHAHQRQVIGQFHDHAVRRDPLP